MKVKDIVEKTKKYEELQNLISNIEAAIQDFDKTKTKDDNTYFSTGYITVMGGAVGDVREESVNVTLSADVNDLIRDDMKALLKKQLKALKDEQEALEI